MALINQENLIGDQLPNVFISFITLEVSGGDTIVQRNPHIETGVAPFRGRDRTGKTVTISSSPLYSSKTTSTSTLLVKVQLLLKEKYDSDQKGAWTTDEEFLKYLKIRVTQSRDKRLTQSFENGEFTIDPESYASSSMASYADTVSLALKDYLKEITEYTYTIDSAGNKIYDVPFETTFAHSDTNPTHLSYFAAVYFDTQQMIDDYTLNLPSELKKNVFGKIVGEKVIARSAKVENATALFLPDKTVYAGPTHKDSRGRLRKGAQAVTSHNSGHHHEYVMYIQNSGLAMAVVSGGHTHSIVNGVVQPGGGAANLHTHTLPPPLSKKTVPNSTVKDLRDAQETERVQIDFSLIEEAILGIQSTIGKVSVTDKLYVPNMYADETYFSDSYMSRDKDGNCRFLFTLDFYKALREKTHYGALLSTTDDRVKDELLNSCIIKEVKVFRRRVKSVQKMNRLGSIVTAREPYSTISEPELIGINSRATAGTFDSKTLYRNEYGGFTVNSSAETSIIGVLGEVELASVNSQLGLRHFMVMDDSMSEVTDGLYQYGVEFTIQDSTKEYLKKQLDSLSKVRDSMLAYYAEASDPKYFDVKTNRFTQKFIELKDRQYPILRSRSEGVVTAIKNQTLSPKTEVMVRNSNRQNIEHAPYIRATSEYLKVLNTMTMNAQYGRIKSFTRALYSMCSPKLGTPDGILTFLQLIENLMLQVQRTIGENNTQDRSRSKAYTGKALPKFTVTRYFDETFDSNVLKETGYDYLSGQDQNNLGLRVVNGQEYIQRATSETEQYFTTTDLTLNLGSYLPAASTNDTELTFLTPASVQVGGVTLDIIDQGSSALVAESYQAMESLITMYNSSDSGAPAPLTTALDTTINYTPVVADTGTTMTTLQGLTDAVNRISAEEEMVVYSDIRPYLGEGSNQVSASLDSSILSKFGSSTLASIIFPSSAPSLLTSVLASSKITGYGVNRTTTTTSNIGTLAAVPTNTSTTIPTIQTYNLSAVTNGLELMRNSPIDKSSVAALPNQVLSLFAASLGSTKVATNVFSASTDIAADPDTEGYFRFNYSMINQVECFIGYGESTGGDIETKESVWVPLDYSILNGNVGGNILCRIREYENPALDIYCSNGLELPTYDEHFILKPTEEVQRQGSTYYNPFGSTAVLRTTSLLNSASPADMTKTNLTSPISITSDWAPIVVRDLGLTATKSEEIKIPTEYISTMHIKPSTSLVETMAVATAESTLDADVIAAGMGSAQTPGSRY